MVTRRKSTASKAVGFFKNLPARYISVVTALITFVATVASAVLVVDSRYAHAGKVEEKLDQLQSAQTYSINTLRKSQIEDRIFEINMRQGRQQPSDRALLHRYEKQLQEVNRALEKAAEPKTQQGTNR